MHNDIRQQQSSKCGYKIRIQYLYNYIFFFVKYFVICK